MNHELTTIVFGFVFLIVAFIFHRFDKRNMELINNAKPVLRKLESESGLPEEFKIFSKDYENKKNKEMLKSQIPIDF